MISGEPRPEADAQEQDVMPVRFPAPANRLIGRAAEVAAVRLLLRASRLVTLTGPPGVGKTRLALAVAAAPDFAEAPVFVDLARIRDPALVLPEIARVFTIADAPDEALADRVAAALGDRRILLVLDNFEHVLDAAPELARFLGRCAQVRVLATSRERLRLSAEREFTVAPLPVPTAAEIADPDMLSDNPTVALLVERACQPNFAVTRHNAAAVGEICIRLDGLPLAIELAAARLKVFSPGEVVTRLGNRMGLLIGGARDLAGRHRTLRAAIKWSHDLLAARERMLLRRLAVFVGGWTLSAAERVCAVPDVDFVDALGSLLDKSLILRTTRADGTAGFAMLESIREFAAEQLERHDDVAALRARHAAYYAERASSLQVAVTGPGEAASYAWMGEEHGNLRVALADRRAAGDLATALKLAVGLGWYLYTRGRLGEGKAILDGLLSAADPRTVPEDTLVDALVSVGFLASARGDLDDAQAALTRGRALAERAGDRRSMASSALCLGHVARGRGRYDEATARYEEALGLFTEFGHDQGALWAWQDLGMLAAERGDLAEAERSLRDSLRRSRDIGYPWAVAWAAWGLGTVLLRRDARDEASTLLGEALRSYEAVDDRRGVAQCLEAFADVAAGHAAYHAAARLLGAATAMRQTIAAGVSGDELHRLTMVDNLVTQAIGPAATDRARQDGRGMSRAAAIELAMSSAGPDGPPTEPTVRPAAALTAREREVAAMVAASSTNRQIGRALGITEKTAEVHIRNIMGKLRVASRAGIASWAAANGLYRPDP